VSEQLSFIETQFPVSKMSKESYKERKSSQGQTITGLGKWWGRKPLILVRSAILGCLLPASNNPKKDAEIFLKLMSMDNDGLLLRKEKKFTVPALYEIIKSHSRLGAKYAQYFDTAEEPVKLIKDAPRDEIEAAAFNTLGYDDKIAMCMRPEQLENLSEQSWNEINQHLGTSAKSLPELVGQLSAMRFGHNVRVGDCFCGGGSIPFEAARIGCDAYASDLNPVAGLLTWADLHICGASEEDLKTIQAFQECAYNAVDKEIRELGIEQNEKGDRALSYLYCVETKCPECGWTVPMLPSFVVGIRAGKVIAELHENTEKQAFDISIIPSVSDAELKKAQENGTVQNNALVCPHCGRTTPISVIRRDRTDENGNTVYGLRLWEQNEFEARPDDVYRERLYAIRYEHEEVQPNGKSKTSRYYRAPSERDMENEKKVHDLVAKHFDQWQAEGLVPSMKIESGYNTDQIIRERGWAYWHQLFNARQLFVLSRFAKQIQNAPTQLEKAAGILGLNKCADFSSKLCRWDPSTDKIAQTFYNQAFNTLMNHGTRSLRMLNDPWYYVINSAENRTSSLITLLDARVVKTASDLWITDPPYADAVNYHELSEFFLAWDKSLLPKAFPDWYTDSKRILAVRGDEHFSQTMIDIYSNLTKHMPDDGMQVVMFTHSDPAVWAQLAIIMWKSGLKVTAAWNIATETDASGLKNGNYVKGTVLLVLRKQTGSDMAFLDEINADIRSEVKNQIDSMQALDDKEEPNFADPDYVLAAYAASLKVLTSYASIEDLDLDFELNQAISNPSGSKVVAIIENAKKIAYDCVIPLEFDSFLWRELSNAEKFYIKGLESEKHGDYQISTYQEFARGFSIGGYSQMMASERANTARLKTPYEMATRTVSDVPDFEKSLLRTIFTAIYVGIKEDENPNKALGYLKNELPNYWDKRDMIKQLISFLVDTKDISNMQVHWRQSADMAELLLALVEHDSV
jgi:adenine-specific DNA methylase